MMKQTKITLFIAALLLLFSGCRKNEPATINENDADFGVGATVDNIFDVRNADEWNDAANFVAGNGDIKNYVINILDNFSLSGTTASTFGSVTAVKVSIRGDKTITLSSNGSLIYAGAYQTVILRKTNLTGKSDNNAPLVNIANNAAFVMNSGVIGSNSSSVRYSGVYCNNGTFIMNGGNISENSANNGSVYVFGDNGSFVMNGGTISGNNSLFGAGVQCEGCIFNMSNGTISGNSATNSGGGIYMDHCTSSLSGGTISGNSARFGGGVAIFGSTFSLSDGTVSGNKADNFGGGVFLDTRSNFTKTGNSVIYGNTSSTHKAGGNNNTALSANSGAGHAVCIFTEDEYLYKYRDATAGAGVDMSWDGTTAVGFEN